MSKFNRREMIQTSTALGVGFWMGTTASNSRAEDSPNEKLNLAVIGPGGRGATNLSGVSSQNIVAICDVDDTRAGKAYEKYPKAKKYYDFRKMLSEMENKIDGVVISTPDHTHFHPAMMSMEMKKHVYCEKPMAHNVWEIRTMTDFAKKQGVATQLGAQRHAFPNMHRVVELIQAGAIGTVKEVHSWVAGERGMPALPKENEVAPKGLKWDLWVGPAAERAYHLTYCPYGWRFWWDFGTGEMGNWGCHILDIPFWALQLTYPTHVEAEGPKPDARRTPKQLSVQMDFPANGDRPPLKLHYHHAKKGPAILKDLGLNEKGNNNLFIGDKGMLLTGFDSHKLLPKEDFADFKKPEKTIPDSPGFYKEWFTACKGGEAATCNFDYTGPLSEAVLLGSVAYRSGSGFDWDSKNLKAIGNDQAAKYLREEYRKGWEWNG